jgi:hypothetical protein
MPVLNSFTLSNSIALWEQVSPAPIDAKPSKPGYPRKVSDF